MNGGVYLRRLDSNQDDAPPFGIWCRLGNIYSESSDDGRRHDGDRFRVFRAIDRLRFRLRLALRRTS